MSGNYSQSLKLLNFFLPIQQLQHRLPFVEQQNLNDVKPCYGFNLTACHNILFDIKKIVFNMYNCCCKRLNENRDKLY